LSSLKVNSFTTGRFFKVGLVFTGFGVAKVGEKCCV